MQDLFSLAGRVALVTGSSRGIGLAIARALARAGARVVLNGRRQDTLMERVAELDAAGLEVSATPFDATDREAVQSAVARIVGEYGRLDIAVGNAGTVIRKALVELTPEDFETQMTANLDSCFLLARAAAPHMIEAGGGRIIFTGSVLGTVARPGVSAYIASKAALAGLARALAVELGPRGVTCNAIAPGFITTELTTPLQADETFRRWVEERTPLGRWGEVDEIAGAALFLASPAGAYCNGHTLVIDGGLSVNA